MKKLMTAAWFLVILTLMCWAGTIPCLAYYPPLTDITGPTVTQDTDTKVTVSVHDPATGKDIPYTWTIPGGAETYAVDQLRNVQGMVAWRVQDLTNNKYQIVCGVYDPNPEMGWQFYTNWGEWLDHETDIVSINDGVVLYEYRNITETHSEIRTYMATYDPAKEMPDQPFYVGWRGFSDGFIDYSGAADTYGHIVKDGTAAYVYYSPSYDYVMIYAIYDSQIHAWFGNQEYFVNQPSPPNISAATVTWTADEILHKRGYDPADYDWHNDENTKVLANYVYAPSKPKPRAPVYFTDMSIAAANWNYDLGDGSTSNLRSFYHTYKKAGSYLVSQKAFGPTGQDTTSQTISVRGPVMPAIIMFLMDEKK